MDPPGSLQNGEVSARSGDPGEGELEVLQIARPPAGRGHRQADQPASVSGRGDAGVAECGSQSPPGRGRVSPDARLGRAGCPNGARGTGAVAATPPRRQRQPPSTGLPAESTESPPSRGHLAPRLGREQGRQVDGFTSRFSVTRVETILVHMMACGSWTTRCYGSPPGLRRVTEKRLVKPSNLAPLFSAQGAAARCPRDGGLSVDSAGKPVDGG